MTGLELRKGKSSESIRIVFTYRGVLCKETLKLNHTKSNIAYATRKRGEVINAIARETFKYHEFFPESTKARLFGKVPSNITIGSLLETVLASALKSQSPSTYRGYKQVCESHLLKRWEKTLITDLNRSDLRDWIGTLTAKRKTILNILTPLRNAVTEAVDSGLIEFDPFTRLVLDKILSNEQKESTYVVDPFSIEEIYSILDACDIPQERNLWKFVIATGMRTSEFIALQWDSIDFSQKKIRVVQKRVQDKTIKKLKTTSGKRSIDIRSAAWEALIEQKKYMNKEYQNVFIDPRSDAPWKNDNVLRKRFAKILKIANVRYRNPYQTRHTFASSLLSNGENPLYIANQMGHANVEMIQKVYGVWIDQGNNPSSKENINNFFKPYKT